MKLLLSILIYGVLISSPCSAQTLPAGRNEVIFPCYFREYGWLFYGSDGKKFDRPMQSILDVYEVVYHLNPDSLTIWKRPYSNRERPTIVYGQVISKADSKLAIQLLAATNPETLGKMTVDDGLPDHAQEATVVLGGRSTSFAVGEEPTILALMRLIDRLAPLKYKLYEPNERVGKQ